MEQYSAPDWLLWQWADSAFPVGGFAHSAGLEAAWQGGYVREADALADFLAVSLRAMARGVAPFAVAARREPERVLELDAACDLFLNNHVPNRASRVQGQALIRFAEEIFSLPRLTALRDRVRRNRSPCHYAPMFGVCAAELGIREPTTAQLFLFVALRGCVSSAVRLGISGLWKGSAYSIEFPVISNSGQRFPDR